MDIETLRSERKVFEILKSECVAKAYYSLVHENYLCFLMEYVVGGDFSTILNRYTALDEVYVKHYMAELV